MALICAGRAQIEDDANKLKVFPALYVGVSHTF